MEKRSYHVNISDRQIFEIKKKANTVSSLICFCSEGKKTMPTWYPVKPLTPEVITILTSIHYPAIRK